MSSDEEDDEDFDRSSPIDELVDETDGMELRDGTAFMLSEVWLTPIFGEYYVFMFVIHLACGRGRG